MVSEPQQLDPQAILDADRFMAYETALPRVWTLEHLLRLIDRPGLSVCDVGGATGRFLDELDERCDYDIRGTVLEVDGRYRERQIRPDFDFVEASIVDNDLPSGSFDFVTLQHVFHHLVADSVRDTLALQERALDEIVRITRPGGYVLFEEQVNRVRAFSRIVYLLSRLANRYRVKVSYFEAGTVVVSYLTPDDFEQMMARRAQSGLEVVDRDFVPWEMEWRWRLTLLMSRVGAVSYLLRV